MTSEEMVRHCREVLSEHNHLLDVIRNGQTARTDLISLALKRCDQEGVAPWKVARMMLNLLEEEGL